MFAVIKSQVFEALWLETSSKFPGPIFWPKEQKLLQVEKNQSLQKLGNFWPQPLTLTFNDWIS